MRIAQVVTYVSPDGAFGGPVTVAAGQCASLAAMGHDVALFAAAPIEEPQTSIVDGYAQHLFPVKTLIPRTGFAGIQAKGLLKALKATEGFDVAHVHMARDLVTLPAARYFQRAGVPTVIQTHGMIDRSHRILAKILDIAATRKILTNASAVLSLTSIEDLELTNVAPNAAVERIGNGIRLADLPTYERRSNEVVFIARLHSRKRAIAFVEMAKILLDDYPETHFVLYGPDEGEGAAVQAAITTIIEKTRIRWLGAADPKEVPHILSESRVFVLPSFGEVFPMTILEALRAGTPVVTTGSLGIAEDCKKYGAAVITDGSPQELARAVSSILRNSEVAMSLRDGGERYLREELNIETVTQRLEVIYNIHKSRSLHTARRTA